MSFSDPNTRRNVLIGTALVGAGLGAYLLLRNRKKPAPVAESEPVSESESLKRQGNEEFKASRFESAVEFYTKALALEPSEPHVMFSNRAVSYVKLGRFEEALADADTTIKLKPDFARGYERRGQALIALNRFNEALIALERAATIEPSKQKHKAFLELVQTALAGSSAENSAEPTPAPTPATEEPAAAQTEAVVPPEAVVPSEAVVTPSATTEQE